jgi:hypothetical protein
MASRAERPDPNAWREAITQEELAQYNRGLYDVINAQTGAKDLHKAPLESNWISRDNRLVSVIDNVALAKSNPTTEQNLRAAEINRNLAGIDGLSQSCVRCGQNLLGRGEDRDVILRFRDGATKVFMYCPGCSGALGLELESDPWFASQPKSDRRMWELQRQGMTQPAIAAELEISQQTVSSTLARMVKQIGRNRRQ